MGAFLGRRLVRQFIRRLSGFSRGFEIAASFFCRMTAYHFTLNPSSAPMVLLSRSPLRAGLGEALAEDGVEIVAPR